MAFSDPISVNDIAAAVQQFTRVAMNGFRSEWVETDATASDMRRLILQHGNAGVSVAKGQKPVRRHAQSWIHEKYNATLGKMEKLVVNLTITVDPGATFTTTNVDDLVVFAKNFTTQSNTLKLIRDEI